MLFKLHVMVFGFIRDTFVTFVPLTCMLMPFMLENSLKRRQ